MKQYNEHISYEILENGYMIYLDGEPWISQLDQYSKPYDKDKSYEENCIMQLDDITSAANATDEASVDGNEVW